MPVRSPGPWPNRRWSNTADGRRRHGLVVTVSSSADSSARVEESDIPENSGSPQPRDATIIITHPAASVSAGKLALVWDEVTGWRQGVFQSGEQGVRTDLADVSYLGGGVLPEDGALIGRVRAGPAGGGTNTAQSRTCETASTPRCWHGARPGDHARRHARRRFPAAGMRKWARPVRSAQSGFSAVG